MKSNKPFYIVTALIIIVSLIGIILLKNIDKNKTIIDPISDVYTNQIGNITDYHSEKIIIYLFYWQGCGYCKNEIAYLKEIKEKYGEYVELKSYESFKNKKNY